MDAQVKPTRVTATQVVSRTALTKPNAYARRFNRLAADAGEWIVTYVGGGQRVFTDAEFQAQFEADLATRVSALETKVG